MTALIKSIQKISTTLATGVFETNPAISAVVLANAIIIPGGSTQSGNSTTINEAEVAWRFNSTTDLRCTKDSAGTDQAVTAYCTVVEFESGVIQSNQVFAKDFSGAVTSVTQTITGVTTANSLVILQGLRPNGAASANPALNYCTVELTNSTTVTCRMGVNNTLNPTVYFTVLEFVGSVLNSSIQQVSIAISSATSNTATISSVTPGQTMLFWGGWSTALLSGIADASPRIDLTDGTTVTSTRNSSSVLNTTIKCSVVEFAAAAINAVHRGTIALSGINSNTATISAVDEDNSFASYLGMSSSDAGTGLDTIKHGLVLTDATTVTANTNTAPTTLTASYEVGAFASAPQAGTSPYWWRWF